MAPGIHIGSSLVPAALAAAELKGGCSGSELLAALVAGCELGARFNLTEPMDDRFGPTGVAIVFPATAAAARVLGLDEKQALNALGLLQGPQALTQLVAQQLEGAALFVRVEPGRMDQQPRRLGDRDEVAVEVQHGQR